MLDNIASFEETWLWLILGVPAGFIALWILFISIESYSDQYTNERPHRQINERERLLPSHVPQPRAETPLRIVSSQSSYTSRLPIDTAPRVTCIEPSSSFRTAVNPRLPQYTPMALPSPAVADARRTAVVPGLPHKTTPISSFPAVADARRTAVVLGLPHNTAPISPPPAVADTRRPLHANLTSGSSSTVTGRQVGRVAQNSTQPVRKAPRPEVDGMLLHTSVTAEVDDRYFYDQNINTNNAPLSTNRSVVGVFKCYSCKRKKSHPEEPRTWTSCGICVEIWMSGPRYRTRLHSQKCNRCDKLVEPEVDKDDYVTKVVRVLDGWTGQHSVVKPLQSFIPTGPHQRDKCNACQKGICHQKAKSSS